MDFNDNIGRSRMLPPLPERMRPHDLDGYVGQKHLVGEGGVIRNMIQTGNLTSFILWGPPGVGKTTLARIVAKSMDREFFTLSAVSAGVKEVREVIEKARTGSVFSAQGAPVLFIDEIHRFSKSQQDALLGAVEDGTVILIGATTENPSFEVNTPLLSRCQVFVLKSLGVEDLEDLLERAVKTDVLLKGMDIEIRETGAIFRYSGGDARKLLNILEIVAGSFPAGKPVVIDNASVTACIQENMAVYDKSGEMHYDIISAFIKSVRGSDPRTRFSLPTPASRLSTISVCPRRGSRSPRPQYTWHARRRATRHIWPSTRPWTWLHVPRLHRSPCICAMPLQS